MIENFDDFCLWMYVVVDDVMQSIAPVLQRSGPAAEVSDSEIMTMALLGACRGLHQETEMLSYWRERPDLFPQVPSQSRFNRRRRALLEVFKLVRQIILRMMEWAHDAHCTLDSLPVPVVGFHLAPGCSATWKEHGASYGKVSSKKITIFGYKLHLLVTLEGLILDCLLAPAHMTDLSVAEDLLAPHTDLTVLADKAFISQAIAERLRAEQRIALLTIPRANQRHQLPASLRRLHNQCRQIIETVNGQLAEQFQIEVNHAHTFLGLCTRLLTKLTAHTLSIYCNLIHQVANPLQIKPLAFPN
jgi:Transposase DDE domain